MVQKSSPRGLKTLVAKRLKCKRCDYRWNYKGESVWFATCPRCRNSNVRIISLNEKKSERVVVDDENRKQK